MTLQDDIDPKELLRLQIMNNFEEQTYSQGFTRIAGIDEAGRGPLAGPVVAAACIIPRGVLIPYVNDSKLLTPKKREELFKRITEDERIIYKITCVDVAEIDRINIYQATIQGMLSAIAQLTVQPDYLLVDGLQLPHPTISCRKLIKGDSLSQSIAAASVLAKVTRDQLMKVYHNKWPMYGFDRHKGYGVPAHLEALKKHGPCEGHRASFEPIKSMLERLKMIS